MQQEIDDRGAGAHDPVAGQRGRAFGPGQSGNPRGRPQGARNKITLMLDALLDGEAEEIGRKAVELAKAGDSRALKACFDRLLPARRDRFVPFELPPIASASDLPAASAALLFGVASGEITPSEAAGLAKLLDTHARALAVDDMERRLAQLEVERSP